MYRRLPKKDHIVKHHKILGLSITLLLAGVFMLWIGSLKVPDLGSFEERKVQNSTKIYDRTGKVLLYDVHQNIKRTVVPFSEVGQNIKNATISIEDRDFYTHGGIRIASIFRAVLANIFSIGYSQGGSTITQQVVKNALLTQDKKISRKLKEWVLAVKLERIMSKDDILALYLNEAPYGGEIYGVGEATTYYFGKTPSELTLAESAYLAAIPQSPTRYSPYGKNKALLDERKDLVLSKMKEQGFINEDEYENAKKEVVVFAPQNQGNAKALHFVMWVREYLVENYGEDALSSGLKVTTTLDYNLQKKAEDIVSNFSENNLKNFNASNASLVAVDPKTGQVLTMVGSKDYFSKDIDGSFNVALAHRQPGSSFKPIVYVTAFEKGYTPDTVLFDLQTEFQTTCTPEGKPLPGTTDECYMPENYDNKFRGPISLREALAQSINIPAIKLLYLVGINDALKTARDLGVKSLKDRDQYGLTLVLGGGEVSLLDMTSAYSVFANNGVKNPTEKILKIEDGQGRVLEEWSPKPEEVLPKEPTEMLNDVLSDNNARIPAYGERSALYFPGREVAVKTGTTNDYRDAWILGYTPSIAVGAWAGNNDNSPMEKKVAGFIIAPLWNAFMTEALKELPNEKFEKPKKEIDLKTKPVLRGVWTGGKSYLIDKVSGKLATENTPKETLGEVVITEPHSILYWVDKNDPTGEAPNNPENDSQFKLWEIPVQKWVAAQRNIPVVTIKNVPTTYDDIHSPQFAPSIVITEPNTQRSFSYGDLVGVVIKNNGKYPINKIDYFLNNNFIGTSNGLNQFSFVVDENNGMRGINELKVVVYDTVYNNSETLTSFYIR